jgi:hypothetical protein
MCAATDTLDIALAALGVDIIAPEIDGDGITPGFEERLNFDRCLAFQQFQLITNPMVYEFSNIDTSPSPSSRDHDIRLIPSSCLNFPPN